MNKRMLLISVVVWMLLLLAAAVSATHIVESAEKLGLSDWQRYTTPALIDLVAVVGKISMASMFSPTFRRSGLRLLMVGATLSLAANVYAGDTWGERGFGVLVVGSFMLLENHAAKAGRQAVVDPKPSDVDVALAAKRSAAARKAAETRKRNQAKRARRPKAPAAAPVSPATVSEIDSISG